MNLRLEPGTRLIEHLIHVRSEHWSSAFITDTFPNVTRVILPTPDFIQILLQSFDIPVVDLSPFVLEAHLVVKICPLTAAEVSATPNLRT